jgi:hypothetical protein
MKIVGFNVEGIIQIKHGIENGAYCRTRYRPCGTGNAFHTAISPGQMPRAIFSTN